MKWLDRIFHEPADKDIERINDELKTERVRHSEELGRINQALADYERTRKLAEGEVNGRGSL